MGADALILGIETSCDETAAAVVEGGRRVLSSVVASQHKVHEAFGGVVPELASRAHVEAILPMVREALTRAGVAALLSNSDHERIRELYGERGFGFETVLMSRAINSVGSGRAPIPELLIDNFGRPEVRAAMRR